MNIFSGNQMAVFNQYCYYKSITNNNIKLDEVKSLIKNENKALYEVINENVKMDQTTFETERDTYTVADLVKNIDESSKYISSVDMGECTTPESLVKLASSIINLNDGESLLEQGSGIGNFLINVGNESNKLTGVEINPEVYAVSVIRAEISGKNIELINNDIFRCKTKKVDKVFSNCPFGMRFAYLNIPENHKLVTEYDFFTKSSSADWAFALNAVNSLNKNGKAVLVVTPGCLNNKPDAKIRKMLLDKGLVETVIALPEKLFSGTNTRTYMLVLSQGNEQVSMIDATKCVTVGRRINTISDEDVNTIIDSIGKNVVGFSKVVNNEELCEDIDFVLDSLKFTTDKVVLENDAELGEYLVSIRRASRITASELDEIATEEETDMKTITMGDIQDVTVSQDLSSISELPDKYESFVVNKNDILIARAGSPKFKVALYEGNDENKAVAVGNLYVITVDDSKIDPYYLAAFLNSKLGQERLSANATGSTIIVLPVEGIKKLQIPVIDIDKQREIGAKAKALTKEVQSLKIQLNNSLDALSRLTDDLK